MPRKHACHRTNVYILLAIGGVFASIILACLLKFYGLGYLVSLAATVWMGPAYEQPPILTLHDFVKYKKSELMESHTQASLAQGTSIHDILIEGMDHFVGVSCIQGQEFELVREALYQQLKSVPEAVREEVVNSALIRETSIRNVVQNSSKPLQLDGRASAYLGWWNTRFIAPSQYDTCVMVSGISFTAAETVSGFIEEKRTERIGTQPCKCGVFYCEKCPLLVERTYSMPVYKRHAISLKDHTLLHQHMIKTATDMASEFIQTSVKELPPSNAEHDGDWKALDGWQLKTNRHLFQGE